MLLTPNPSQDYLLVQFTSVGVEASQQGRVQIINSLGKVVVSDPLQYNQTRLNTSHLPAGLYTAHATLIGGKSLHQTFVVQH